VRDSRRIPLDGLEILATRPTFAIDNKNAMKVLDGTVEVVPEGQRKRFAH